MSYYAKIEHDGGWGKPTPPGIPRRTREKGRAKARANGPQQAHARATRGNRGARRTPSHPRTSATLVERRVSMPPSAPWRRRRAEGKGVYGVEDEEGEDAGVNTIQDFGDLELCAATEGLGFRTGRNGAKTWGDLPPGLANLDDVDRRVVYFDPRSGCGPWAERDTGEFVSGSVTRRLAPPCPDNDPTESAWRAAASSVTVVDASFMLSATTPPPAPHGLAPHWPRNLVATSHSTSPPRLQSVGHPETEGPLH